jgi:ABC-type lipoprotein release transport system permease subunit
MLDPQEEGYILIGANMLKKFSSFADADIPGLDLLTGVDVGSRVRLTVSNSDGTVMQKDFTIKGIVKSKVDQISTRLFMPDNELRRMISVNKEEVQEIAISVDPVYAPTLVKQVTEFLSDPTAARVQTSEDAIPSFLRDIETTFSVLGNALSSIALIVASITIFIVIFINAITNLHFS